MCVLQHALGQTPPGQTHTPLDRHPPGRPPPQQTATAADGMHPTGMHSCVNITIEINVFLLSWCQGESQCLQVVSDAEFLGLLFFSFFSVTGAN